MMPNLQLHVGGDHVVQADDDLALVGGAVRRLDVCDLQGVTAAAAVVIQLKPLVLHKEAVAGANGEVAAAADSIHPHPQNRILLSVGDGAAELNVAA
jgi:hypothetical protein